VVSRRRAAWNVDAGRGPIGEARYTALVRSRGLIGCSLGILLVTAPGTASAQDDAGVCEEPAGRGPLFVTPTAGGRGVTLDAQIRVRYSPGYFVDPVIGADPATSISLVECPDDAFDCPDGFAVAGTAQAIGDVLVFTPETRLLPRTWYQGVANGDFNLQFRFETGTTLDLAPPEMGRIVDVRSQRVEPSCEAPDGGYRIDVVFDPATDDGARGDIEYLLYLTRGPEVEAPELRDRLRNFATPPRITMAFVLEAREAVSPICVTVYAVDGVGNIDDDTEPHCFDPIQGNFFEPLCSCTSVPRDPPASALALLLPVALLAARRWARARRPR
jgi:hypothetical protein